MTIISPHDIDFDSKGNVCVSDRDRNDIQKFSPKGTFILKWGHKGKHIGEFNTPYSISIDKHDNVYVVDRDNNHIEKFDSNGKFIKQSGSEGRGPGQLDLGLEHLFVDPKNNVWQVDARHSPRIQEFDNNGNYLTQVGSGPCMIPNNIKNDPMLMASYNKCYGKLDQPEHANINSEGDRYVADRGNQWIVVYHPVRDANSD